MRKSGIHDDGLLWEMAKDRVAEIALALIVLQTTAHVLAMRFTRMAAEPYLASTVVLLMELVKLVVCTAVVFYEETNPINVLWTRTVVEWQQTLRVGIPALCYVIQNNLLFIAATELDAPVFQVLNQFKLITTAFFSVLILGRKLSTRQWGAVALLACGVMVVQSSTSKGSASGDAAPMSTRGLTAIMGACALSGFAGVWFERMLKQTGVNAASLWLRNVQLASCALPLAALKVWYSDGETIMRDGFFVGYTPLVILTVLLGSAGGLLVAVVVKYTDNIMKGFAASISAVLSTVISMNVPAFGFRPQPSFFFGAAIVFTSAYVYGMSPRVFPPQEKKTELPLSRSPSEVDAESEHEQDN